MKATRTGRGAVRSWMCAGALLVFAHPASAEFTKFKWATQDQPAPREAPAFAFDSVRGRAVLFGGNSAAGALSDSWEWDGRRWSQGTPFFHPPPRSDAGMVFDPTTGRMALFGGAGTSVFADTWTWNGSSWLFAQPTVSPSARISYASSYDSLRERWVLFGGRDATGQNLNDTWEYDAKANQWTKFTPSKSPVAVWFPAMAFDKKHGKTMFVGGAFENPNSQHMWEWDGTTWTELTAFGTVPGLGGATVVYDEKRDKLVKFGGFAIEYGDQTFEYHYGDAAWVERTPLHKPVAAPGNAIYDAARETVLLYQGQSSDLWEWDGVDWTHRGPGLSPRTRGNGVIAYDSDRKRAVIFGGAFGANFADTWEWDQGSWIERSPAVVPAARSVAAMTYDSTHKYSLLVTGQTDTGPTDETWTWDGTNWTLRSPPQRPTARAGAALAHDSNRGKAVLFGGYAGAFLSDTWEWDGSTWAKKNPANQPSPRILHAMEFDAVRQQTVLFGGAFTVPPATFSPSDETWLYDGTNWTQAAPAHHPSARAGARMTYDEGRKKVVLFAGESPAVSSELWAWDGTDWSLIDVDATPVTQGSTILMSYDGNTLMTFGTGSRLTTSATLLLAPKTDVCTVDAECAGGTYCVDGVCCQARSCNACETCNGLLPGTCSPIFNEEDADSCAVKDGKSCDAKGACRSGLGTTCSDGATCASGFCVDGVCCDSRCDGTCVSCSSEKKEEAARSGLCGPSKGGTDPREQCAPSDVQTCGLDGTCDGRGGCRVYPKGTVCSQNNSGRFVCDGLGTCSNDTACFDDTHRLAPDGSQGETCGGFRCGVVGCLAACVSLDDCEGGFVCDFEGRCVNAPVVENPPGCATGTGYRGSSCWIVSVGVGAFFALRRRRARSARA